MRSLQKTVRHRMSIDGTYEIVEMEQWAKKDIDRLSLVS